MSISNLYPGGDNPVTVNLGLALYDMSYEMAENFIILDAAIGSESVQINGTVIPNVNFVNSVSVTFSVVGSNVSATAAITTPGGVTGDIQYNNAGAFGGSAATIDATGNLTTPSNATFIAASNTKTIPTLNLSAPISNIVETSGSVVTLTVTGNTFSAGNAIVPVGLTTGTWLNGRLGILSAGTNATTLVFTDTSGHGILASHSETGTATGTIGGFQTGAIFIDPTLVVLVPNTVGAKLAAGTYTVSAAVTDGNGRWSNLVSYTFIADGAHNYGVNWMPPTSWYSGGNDFFTLFTDSSNVYGWVSYNGGTIKNITSATAGSFGFVGYDFWPVEVRFGGGYTDAGTAIPTNLNTLPEIQLTVGGASSQITGAILNAPIMQQIYINPVSTVLGDYFSIVGISQASVAFIDPDGAGPANNFSYITQPGGGIFFENNGTGFGTIYFSASGPGGINGTCYLGAGSGLPNSATLSITGLIIAGALTDNISSTGTSGQILTAGTGGQVKWGTVGGTVTSVSFTGGLISVANQNTTPALTVAGTSGGIPYFSSATTWASSALLASTGLVLGGGAATAPLTSTQLTFVAPTLTVGLAGTSSGILSLTGLTSGNVTITAPAVAGTATNPILISNSTQLPSGTVRNWNADTGISRISAGVVGVGTGAAGSFAGTLEANVVIAQDAAGDGVQLQPGSGGTTGYLGWYSAGSRTAFLGFNVANIMNFSLGMAYLDLETTGTAINGVLTGLFVPTSAVMVGNPGTTGSLTFAAGDGSHSGLFSWYNTAGTRLAFMGFDAGNNVTINLTNSGNFAVAGGGIAMASGFALSWNSDSGISRLAAGSLAIGTGAQGSITGNLSYNRINTAGADYAGQATVTAGNTTKAVSFAANYTGTGQPVIVLTPTSDPLALGVPVGYWVTYSGSAGAWSGFTVNIQTALAGNVTFNYIVIGQA